MKNALMLAAAALAISTLAIAANDSDPATEDIPQVVPYDGVLDFDGAGFNGPVDVVFTLYDSAEGGEVVWSETWSTAEQRAVNVTSGRFSVNLGTFEDIDAVIADAGQVYLGLAVKRPNEAEYTDLRGRQRLNPVPYALWGSRASNLTVAGVASIGGDLTVGATTHTDDLVVDDQIIANRIFLEGANNVAGRLFSHFNGWLYMGEADTFENGLSMQFPMRAEQGAEIQNGLTASGGATVSGGLTLDGGTLFMHDANSAASALTFTNNYLRIGVSDAFGNGVRVAHDLRVNQDAQVDQDLTVSGDVSLEDCRLCMNFRDTTGVVRQFACVNMVSGGRSGFQRFQQDIGNDDEFELLFVCDGRGSDIGFGNVDADPDTPD